MWICVPTVVGVLAPLSANSAVLTSLYSFSSLAGGNNTNFDGAATEAELLLGTNGYLYGTCSAGGSNGLGTVFKVTTSGSLTVLHTFSGADGQTPWSGLVDGNDGYYYGTTSGGGVAGGYGTVFKITPSGLFTRLHSFKATDGAYPGALVKGNDGSFYGATQQGSTNNYGNIFRMTSSGELTPLVAFNLTNGQYGVSRLMQASDGSLYGTTYGGGTNGGFGTIFKLTLSGSFTSVFSFNNTNGAYPYLGPLAQDSKTNLYGTTWQGGANGGYGTIFRITLSGSLTSLYSFDYYTGEYPIVGLTIGGDGNCYGVTGGGGTNGGYGTIFQITSAGAFNSLFSFNETNGFGAASRLVQASGAGGSFFGTTSMGGTNGTGTIFQISFPPVLQTRIEAGSTITLNWSTVTGQAYLVQYSTNLTSQIWNNLGGTNTATNATMTASDIAPPDPLRFYRLLLFP
jgi:uncharacterized repeat protein (TIGR03803 family)